VARRQKEEEERSILQYGELATDKEGAVREEKNGHFAWQRTSWKDRTDTERKKTTGL